MKVELLNDGGYIGGMDDVVFPVIVECREIQHGMIMVSGKELRRVGAVETHFNACSVYVFDTDEYKRIL